MATVGDTYDGSAYKRKIFGADTPTRSPETEVWGKLKRNLCALKKPRNVLILGDLGSGKSSFINTVITVLTGKNCTYVNVGNASCHMTTCLQRLRKQTTESSNFHRHHIGLDNQGSTPGSSERGTSTTNSKLLNLIINGKIPDNCDLLDAIKNLTEGLEPKELNADPSLAIDAIIVVIPADNSNIPEDLLEDIYQQATVEIRKIPVFGVVTKIDILSDKEDEEEKRKQIAGAIKIDPEKVLLCSNYKPNESLDQKKNIKILEFLCLICDPHSKVIESQRLVFENESKRYSYGLSYFVSLLEGEEFWGRAIQVALLCVVVAVVLTLMIQVKTILTKDYKQL